MRRHTNILILLLLTGLCISAGAQNNPYKIDDSLYPIFQRAIKWRTQPQGLLIADTLYAEATQKKDKKAQCLALTIPVSFYLSTNNYEKLEQAATRAKEEARKNKQWQKADEIREELLKKGIVIQDTKEGVKIDYIKK